MELRSLRDFNLADIQNLLARLRLILERLCILSSRRNCQCEGVSRLSFSDCCAAMVLFLQAMQADLHCLRFAQKDDF